MSRIWKLTQFLRFIPNIFCDNNIAIWIFFVSFSDSGYNIDNIIHTNKTSLKFNFISVWKAVFIEPKIFLSNYKHWPQISFTIKETEKKESCHRPSHGGPNLFKSVQSNSEGFRISIELRATIGNRRHRGVTRGNKRQWWSPTGDWNQLRFHCLRGIAQPKSKRNLII